MRRGASVTAQRIAGHCAAARSLTASIALLAGLAVLHARQTTPPPQQPAPQVPRFRAEATLVRVDAYVTSKGQAVEDLRPDDFEVLEDGVRQRVETFEYVRKGRVMPGAQGVAAEEPAPGRLFVLFIDTYHLPWVDRERLERRQIDTRTPQPLFFPAVLPPPIPDDRMLRRALAEIVDRVAGDRDRVAVVTPDIWAAPAFGDKRSVIEELGTRQLDAYSWGQRPPEWLQYEACFPNGPWIEPEMRGRFRLNRTFSALSELVANLELLRDERKAVFLVTRGWDPPPRIRNYVDPRRGNLAEDPTVCSAERYALADKDFTVWLQRIIDDARRANVAFYSMYAHPLITFKQDGPDIDDQTRAFERKWGNLQETNPSLTTRVNADFAAIDTDRRLWYETLTELSKDTYGRAILKMADFDSGLQQIADGLSSYYLLGYYSTNRSRDGAYRKISVNVNRKGVSVRARPGYRAVMPPEVAAGGPRPAPVPPAVNAALSPLSRFRQDVPFHLSVASQWDSALRKWRLQLVGEIDVPHAERKEWQQGWRVEFDVVDAASTPAGGRASIDAGERLFAIAYPAGEGLMPGSYEVRAKAFASDGETVFEDRASIVLPAAPAAAGEVVAGSPRLLRRPNTPKGVFQPTADQRFSRREVLRVEVPIVGDGAAPSLRLIDRQGTARDAGIQPAVVQEAGNALIAVTMPLSNIAPGDYVLEISLSTAEPARKVHVGFRIVG